jgi:HSP20 family protein
MTPMTRETALQRKDPLETAMTSFGWPFGRFFDDVLGRSLLRTEDGDQLLVPAMDVVEDEHGLTLSVELPGLAKEDVKLTVENGVLAISGEKKSATETHEKTWHRMERRYGTFYRAITLPKGVTGEKAEASFENGVLKITLPKSEAVKPKAIAIR